jgi:hypothetical protein
MAEYTLKVQSLIYSIHKIRPSPPRYADLFEACRITTYFPSGLSWLIKSLTTEGLVIRMVFTLLIYI